MQHTHDAFEFVKTFKTTGILLKRGEFDIATKSDFDDLPEDKKPSSVSHKLAQDPDLKIKRAKGWDDDRRPPVKYAIISLILASNREEFVTVFENDGISVDNSVEIGDVVTLNILSNSTAVWN